MDHIMRNNTSGRKILVESFIAGISLAIIILGLMFLAYGLQA